MLWDNLSVPSLRVKNPKGTLDDWTDRLSWNAGKELPLLAARQPRRMQFSSTSKLKPEIMHAMLKFLKNVCLKYLNGVPEPHIQVHAVQAWTDPEGSRRLRIPDFKTIGT